MQNPFDELQAHLGRIEGMMVQLMQQKPVAVVGPEQPISIERVAELLDISVGSVYQIKEIPRYKVNNRLRFFESDILQYIRGNLVTSTADNDNITRRPRRNRRKTSPIGEAGTPVRLNTSE